MVEKDIKNKILVIGDSCIDTFIYGESNKMCPDIPVPILIPNKKVSNGGMALNVYENIQSIYSNVDIITNDNKINKVRYVESKNNHVLLRVDSENKKLDRINNIKNINLKKYKTIIISDYCKGFLEKEDIEYICNNHKNVFIDTKKILGEYCLKAKIIKINNHEYQYNLNAGIDINKFKHNLLVTLGNQGCRFLEEIYPVENVEIKDMSGAGDTFISTLVVKYMETNDMIKSIIFANKCSSIVVQHKGVNKIGDLL